MEYLEMRALDPFNANRAFPRKRSLDLVARGKSGMDFNLWLYAVKPFE